MPHGPMEFCTSNNNLRQIRCVTPELESREASRSGQIFSKRPTSILNRNAPTDSADGAGEDAFLSGARGMDPVAGKARGQRVRRW
jgi:hypothetical protein